MEKAFGPQGWWPTTPPGKRGPVYHPGRKTRLTEKEKFEIAAGALLTQNTAWTNVVKALMQLNLRSSLAPQPLARMPQARLATLVRSSGYFRQKADKLKRFARYLMEHYGGKLSPLLEKPLPEARAELLALHGFGPETADSVLLYAGNRPIFVVDAYTRRIGNRAGLFKTQDYHAIQGWFHRRLPKDAKLFNEYHALLVALGKDFCRTKPLCAQCPVKDLCKTGRKVTK